MGDKIKELIKLVGQLNKLGSKILELLSTVVLLVLAIKTIVDLF